MAVGLRLLLISLLAVANAASAEDWTPTSAPTTNWIAVASSADGSKLAAAVYNGPIYTSQTTVAPRLRLTSSGGQAVISWIVPSPSFVLQENSDLSTTNWTEATAASTLTNLQIQVTVSGSISTRFFRLTHP
jgi:hypothetical protein